MNWIIDEELIEVVSYEEVGKVLHEEIVESESVSYDIETFSIGIVVELES